MHIDEHEDPTATTFAVAHRAQFNSLSSQRCAKLRMAFSFNNTCIAKCYICVLSAHQPNSQLPSNSLRKCWIMNTSDSQVEDSVFPLLLQDWAKSSSFEPSLANIRRESVDKMRELEAPPSPLGHPEDPHRVRTGPGSIAAKVRVKI